MRVLVACEFSGVVRRAFRANGHDAVSCDLIPSEDDSPDHYVGDCRDLLHGRWDMLICHPPCTYLATSGNRWMGDPGRQLKQKGAIEFARTLWSAPIPRIAMENPRSVLSTQICKPTQEIQPWQFGHGEVKATWLWLKGLQPLHPTIIVPGREPRVHRMAPGPERQKNRSRTYTGIAEAMATQWDELLW